MNTKRVHALLSELADWAGSYQDETELVGCTPNLEKLKELAEEYPEPVPPAEGPGEDETAYFTYFDKLLACYDSPNQGVAKGGKGLEEACLDLQSGL